MGFGGMGPGMMGWGSSGQAMCSAMAGHIEGRLVFIKAGLKITQDQSRFGARTLPRRATTQARCSRIALP